MQFIAKFGHARGQA